MEAGQAQPVVRVAVADAHVVVLVDVDRLEQRLVAQPAVRVVGVLVEVGGVRQQFQRVIEVRPRVGVVAVVSVDPMLDGIRLGAGGEVALEDAAALNGATTRLWQNDVTVTGDRTQVLAMYAGEEADEWELDGMAAVTRNPYGAGEAYFVGCDLDVADLTKLIRTYLAAPAQSQQSQANTDVLHTVRKSADAAFDFYLPRGKKEVELQGVEGEPVVLFQTERGEENGSYTVRRNGVLVVRR